MVYLTSLKLGVPGRIRTFDLRIRNPLLYPAELRAQNMLIKSMFEVYRI